MVTRNLALAAASSASFSSAGNPFRDRIISRGLSSTSPTTVLQGCCFFASVALVPRPFLLDDAQADDDLRV
jgi:hypothetical protein